LLEDKFKYIGLENIKSLKKIFRLLKLFSNTVLRSFLIFKKDFKIKSESDLVISLFINQIIRNLESDILLSIEVLEIIVNADKINGNEKESLKKLSVKLNEAVTKYNLNHKVSGYEGGN